MTSRQVLKILKAAGWQVVAQKGSHVQLKHPMNPGRVTVMHPSVDFAPGTLRSIEKQAGIRLRK